MRTRRRQPEQLELFPIAVRLTKVVPERNQWRFYLMQATPTLFGDGQVPLRELIRFDGATYRHRREHGRASRCDPTPAPATTPPIDLTPGAYRGALRPALSYAQLQLRLAGGLGSDLPFVFSYLANATVEGYGQNSTRFSSCSQLPVQKLHIQLMLQT